MQRGTDFLERRLLQAVVAVGSLVPIGAGGTGVLLGPLMLGGHGLAPVDLDSHFRYLSGLLLAIGVGYASAIPRIEVKGRRFQLLTLVVVLGGVGRVVSLMAVGLPSAPLMAALVMELLVTPGLAIWQYRVARMATRAGRGAFTGAGTTVERHAMQTS